MKHCIDCGKEIYYRSTRCRKCSNKGKNNGNWKEGLYTQGNEKFCKNCGKKIYFSSTFCVTCANKLIKRKQKIKWVCVDCGKKVGCGRKRCRACYVKTVWGKGNSNWKDGISKLPYPFNFNKELKELIRKRDNYKCQLCGKPEIEQMQKLTVHHKDYNKQNCDPENLITLCNKCNSRVNSKRAFWTMYFIMLKARGAKTP